jgi:arylsulfatase A-like enzyme/Flp pilus assembly protein TadD
VALELLRSGRIAPLLAALVGLAIGCFREEDTAGGAPEADRDAPLNVLLVTIDTLRADALGAYAPGLQTSPHIDRLAAQGVLFEQVITSQPQTLPSHASILTGKQPYAHGVRSNYGYKLAEENISLAEALRDAGYVTAAEISAAVIASRTRLDQGFGSYRDTRSFDVRLKRARALTDAGVEDVELQERDAADVTEQALRFLRQNQERAFFLWLHYFDPHQTYSAPPEFALRFPGDGYHAEIAFTDQQVGRVVSELEALGLAERTLLVLTSDHGEGRGQHGEETHSFLVYDTTMRVPLIFWGPPALPRGRRIRALVRSVDIAPTLLDWLGLPPLPGIQGVSLRPLMTGERRTMRLTGYGESTESFANFGTTILRTVREGRWKYIHKVNPELYDVERDPGELSNRAASEGERVAELQARLRALLGENSGVEGAEVQVDAEMLAQLAALGYVGGDARPGIEDELAALELSGPDPNDTVADVGRLARAWGRITAKDYEAAVEAFEVLHARYPDAVTISRALARALRNVGRYDEALPVMRRALEIHPDDDEMRMNLAGTMRKLGDLEESESLLRDVVSRDPCAVRPRSLLGKVLMERGLYAERIAMLADGMERCPDEASFRNDYAWALATTPDASLRDGPEALRIAREVAVGAGATNPAFLDTLAAAYAETGEFEKAAEASRRALAALQTREVPEEVLATFQGHLADVEAGRPIREH